MKYYWFNFPAGTSVVVRAESFKDSISRFTATFGEYLLSEVLNICVTDSK